MRDDKNTIFGDHSLVESVISDYWNKRLDPEVPDEELVPVQQWYSCITSHSKLILNLDKIDFTELAKENPIYKRLLKESVSGGSSLVFWKNFMNEIDSENRYLDFPDALFLLGIVNGECKEKSDNYGLFFLNGDSYLSLNQLLFKETDFNLRKKASESDLKSWNGLSRVRHPINSLIITDNYVLKSEEGIAANLIPLLNALLPMELRKTDFQLLIVTQSMEEKLLQNRYSFVKGLIKNILKRPYEIEFSLATAFIGENHDRHLFTNYFMLESGNSFNYFDSQKRIKVNTYLNVFPSYLVIAGPDLKKNKILDTLSGIKSMVINNSIHRIGPCNFIDNRLFTLT